MAADEDQPLTAARVDGAGEDRLTGLPDDVLADILRRVPPRWVAASRCVRRSLRDAIDTHGLLRADLLPLSLAGVFICFDGHNFPQLFARPTSVAGARAVSGNLSFLAPNSPPCSYFGPYRINIEDHCNGLLLLSNDCVVNPATRRWNALPTCPAKDDRESVSYCRHLVYDPTVSPHYKVFMIPNLCYKYPNYDSSDEDVADLSIEESERPRSPCKMYVFSSRSSCWEEKYFLREGDVTRIFSDIRVRPQQFRRAVYFRRALYIHCGAAFVMRISLSNNTYHVIRPPMDIKVEECQNLDVVRSEKGVYFVALDKCWLRVWILNESCDQMEWMLKHGKDLKPVLAPHRFDQRVSGPWILEDINNNLFCSSRCREDNKKESTEEIFEWNSNNDDDVENEVMVEQCDLEDNKNALVEKKLELNSNCGNALNNGDMVEDCYRNKVSSDKKYDIEILGFHPHKEIVFLSESMRAGVAYHLNGLKIEVLGNIYPKDYELDLLNYDVLVNSFPYTPCWIEEFPGNT